MSEYWTVSHGIANRFGYSCRECHKGINKGMSLTKLLFYSFFGIISGEKVAVV